MTTQTEAQVYAELAAKVWVPCPTCAKARELCDMDTIDVCVDCGSDAGKVWPFKRESADEDGAMTKYVNVTLEKILTHIGETRKRIVLHGDVEDGGYWVSVRGFGSPGIGESLTSPTEALARALLAAAKAKEGLQ